MNKKKRVFLTLICSIILLVLSAVPVMAEGSGAGSDGFFSENSRLLDMENLLTESEQESLLKKMDSICAEQKMDIVIVTVGSLNGDTIQAYADTLYEDYSFGYGENRDGVMLMLCMEEREWCVSTSGYGITAFTDAGITYIYDQMKEALSNGAYAEAFNIYVDQCNAFITQARSGKAYDSTNLPKEPLSVMWIPVSLVIGFVIARVIVGNMKRAMKSVHNQESAGNYVKTGSMKVTDRRDLFLYKKMERTQKEKKEEKSESTTHQSSSGKTHGSKSGKF